MWPWDWCLLIHINSLIFCLTEFGITSAIVCPWLDFGLPPRCSQVVWCHWGEIEPFSAMLAQGGLAECDQPEKSPSKYFPTAGNWTRAAERTDSELSWPTWLNRIYAFLGPWRKRPMVHAITLGISKLGTEIQWAPSLYQGVHGSSIWHRNTVGTQAYIRVHTVAVYGTEIQWAPSVYQGAHCSSLCMSRCIVLWEFELREPWR